MAIDHDSVTRLHAWVDPTDPPTVRDAGSRNGTFLGGERLASEDRVPLTAGATLRIGHALVLVDHERALQRVTIVEHPERVDAASAHRAFPHPRKESRSRSPW